MSIYVPVAIQRQVRAKFGDRCAYCRTAEFLTATTFEFEHIVPLSAGGQTIFENVCLSCPMCNRYKSDSFTAIDPLSKMECLLFDPQKQTWTEHFAWSENGSEIIGLTPVGRATVVALNMNRSAMIRVRKMWAAMREHPPTKE